jgi:cation transport protein ChaC
MPRPQRHMALTTDLVTRVARVVEDAGPSPGAVYLTDAEYDIIIREMLAQAPPGELWLFGYGSLLWNPGFDDVESRLATVRGWHRSFCIKVARFRGTRDLNGLMMAPDRGGQCRGMIFRIPADHATAVLNTLFRPSIGGVNSTRDHCRRRRLPTSWPRRRYTGERAPSICTIPSRILRSSESTTAICGAYRLLWLTESDQAVRE